MRLLLLEDDSQLAKGLLKTLSMESHTVDHFESVKAGLNAVKQEHYDLVILDLGLADGNGLEFLKVFRGDQSQPVIILTARDTIEDKIQGLDLGADDYLPKPFDANELQARIRALLRRSSGRSTNELIYGELLLDQQARSITYQGQAVNLSRREYNLLEVLLSNQGKVMSRTNLEQALYNWDQDIESNTLEVHIHNLRKKLFSKLIKTVRGVGYMVIKADP
jgi:two-component system response regulator QseB